MKRAVVLLGAGVLCATAALAQNTGVIAQRQKIYKSFGAATKPVVAILRGQAAYDNAAVQTALKTYAEGAKQLPALFPDDAKTGNNTQALPDIWTHKDDFNGRFAKFAADAQAAQGKITDQASFKTEMPKILANCAGCHKLYRAKD